MKDSRHSVLYSRREDEIFKGGGVGRSDEKAPSGKAFMKGFGLGLEKLEL